VARVTIGISVQGAGNMTCGLGECIDDLGWQWKGILIDVEPHESLVLGGTVRRHSGEILADRRDEV
jgi:hypothetical protein